jgi:hypothetical protein
VSDSRAAGSQARRRCSGGPHPTMRGLVNRQATLLSATMLRIEEARMSGTVELMIFVVIAAAAVIFFLKRA